MKKLFLIGLFVGSLFTTSMGSEKKEEQDIISSTKNPIGRTTMTRESEPPVIDSLVTLTEQEIDQLPITLFCCLLLFGRYAYEH